MNFSTGGWLIGGRPNGLLIRGDHLFLNYQFVFGQWWLINRGGLLILTWHYQISGCRVKCAICWRMLLENAFSSAQHSLATSTIMDTRACSCTNCARSAVDRHSCIPCLNETLVTQRGRFWWTLSQDTVGWRILLHNSLASVFLLQSFDWRCCTSIAGRLHGRPFHKLSKKCWRAMSCKNLQHNCRALAASQIVHSPGSHVEWVHGFHVIVIFSVSKL